MKSVFDGRRGPTKTHLLEAHPVTSPSSGMSSVVIVRLLEGSTFHTPRPRISRVCQVPFTVSESSSLPELLAYGSCSRSQTPFMLSGRISSTFMTILANPSSGTSSTSCFDSFQWHPPILRYFIKSLHFPSINSSGRRIGIRSSVKQ